MQGTSFETRAVHAGREELRGLRVHALPLDLSTTYPIADLDAAALDLAVMADGGRPHAEAVYARLFNPTVARFEEALASLEGAAEAVAFASGMAAMTGALLASRERGRHVVACRPLYGGTDHLLSSGLLGLDVSWAEPHEIGRAIRPETALVVIETPGNPTLGLIDIEDVVRQARGVSVLVDSTLATPVLQRPFGQGAALVLHSATKFLGGHGDVVAGVIATDARWAAALRRVRVATGALLHPLAAYLLHRGLPTLALRVRESQRTAEILAHRLAAHAAVLRVYYPGMPGGDPEKLIGRQMEGPGTMLAFEVRGGRAAAARFLGRLRLLTPAVSLGSIDTLIQHPASLTHQVVDPAVRAGLGISEGLLRASIGLESPDDLWADLDRALDAAADRLPAATAELTTA
jgi:methionine-gamma-lyase